MAINWKAIIIGFFISLIVGILISFIPIIGGFISTFGAAIIVGYIAKGSLENGALNGAIMGFLSRFIESIIIIFTSYTFINEINPIIASIGILLVVILFVIHIIIAAVGGAIGSLISAS